MIRASLPFGLRCVGNRRSLESVCLMNVVANMRKRVHFACTCFGSQNACPMQVLSAARSQMSASDSRADPFYSGSINL